MLLSPLAHPFHPLMGEDFNAVIYNNGKQHWHINLLTWQLTILFSLGIPSLRMDQSDSDFLKTFSDETLEEAFPPTAQEAAELEAAEVFVVSNSEKTIACN